MKDLHNRIVADRVISPVACGTTGTGLTGQIMDLKGYGGVEFIIDYGSVTATAATVTITVLEGAVTGTLTSVADVDLLGTEVLAGLAAGARASGTTKNVSKRVGYGGTKRYVTVKEVPTATIGVLIAVTALMHTPHLAPTDNP